MGAFYWCYVHCARTFPFVLKPNFHFFCRFKNLFAGIGISTRALAGFVASLESICLPLSRADINPFTAHVVLEQEAIFCLTKLFRVSTFCVFRVFHVSSCFLFVLFFNLIVCTIFLLLFPVLDSLYFAGRGNTHRSRVRNKDETKEMKEGKDREMKWQQVADNGR